MPLMRLKFQPGVVKERTAYSSDGTWVDCNLVRFRDGFPEKWEGWSRAFTDFEFLGYCRSLHSVTAINNISWFGVGTNLRFYVVGDDINYDVSPLADEVSLGTNPIATTNGSPILTISDTAHGHRVGDYFVMSGAATVAGISTGALNTTHVISEYVDDDSFRITISENANATTTGGGAAVKIQYVIQAGDQDVTPTGFGWGSAGWGEDEWGGDPSGSSAGRLGIWTQDNWGEDIVACIQGGGIYYWDATNPSDRIINILDLPGADGHAPSLAEFIVSSTRDRHLLAFGCEPYGGGNVSYMTVRWCSQEDIYDWDEANTAGTSGSILLSKGSRLVSAKVTEREILVWSDTALFTMQYIGAPLIYGVETVDSNIDIASLKSPVARGGAVFWLGPGGFYAYDGSAKKLPCSIWDYIYEDINWSQAQKIVGSTNKKHNEVIWFYQSTSSSNDVDKYVCFNIEQGVWTYGTLGRTYWIDSAYATNPLAASTNGKLYYHNTGTDDGESDPPTPLNAYIESAPIELSSEGSFDKGDKIMFIRRILPDIHSKNTGSNSVVYMIIKMLDKPGTGFDQTSSSQVTPSAIIPVQTFTDQCDVRLRGRAMVLRIESSDVDSQWRLGTPRIDVRTDGQR